MIWGFFLNDKNRDTNEHDDINRKVIEIIKLIEENVLSETHLVEIVTAIVKIRRINVVEDIKDVQGEYKTEIFLQTLNVFQWSDDRDKVLSSFIKNITGYDDEKDGYGRKMLNISTAIECVYGGTNLNLILPLSFSIIT